jgi:hypothetical protein
MGHQRPTSYAKPIKKAYMEKYESKKKYIKNKNQKKNTKLTKNMIKKHEENMMKHHHEQQEQQQKVNSSPKKRKGQKRDPVSPQKQQNVVILEYNKMRLEQQKNEMNKNKKFGKNRKNTTNGSTIPGIPEDVVVNPSQQNNIPPKSSEVSLITEENMKLYNLAQDMKLLQHSENRGNIKFERKS